MADKNLVFLPGFMLTPLACSRVLFLSFYLQSVYPLLWRRQWHPTPVLLPGKSHRQRSLVGCSPWGRKESDMTERLHFHFSLSCIGEGNGNPLQYSCLENPRNGGAWWAAIFGVSQSRIWLKQLSSSSSGIYTYKVFILSAFLELLKSNNFLYIFAIFISSFSLHIQIVCPLS